MTLIYLFERKSFYLSTDGYDHQAADAGVLPTLFTSKKSALKYAEAQIAYDCNLYGYEVEIQSIQNPRVKDNCIYAVRMTDRQKTIRIEYSVYQTTTIDY